MKINLLTYSSSGGAGNVMRALSQGFQRLGCDTSLIVKTQSSVSRAPLNDIGLTLDALFDQYIYKSNNWNTLISLKRDKHEVLGLDDIRGDLTVLRWTNGALGNIDSLDVSEWGQVLWGLADTNPFTGVCHYNGTCREFQSNCGSCPALRKPFRPAASESLARKRDLLRRMKPMFVAPTEWMRSHAESASILEGRPLTKILNPLQPMFLETSAKTSLHGAKIRVLVIAANLDDPTKGIWEEIDVLRKLSESPDFTLTLIGRTSSKLQRELVGASFLGSLSSHEVLGNLQNHDLLLVPSLFETAGMVIAEAASQALPSIVRGVGGMSEMIQFGKAGFIFTDSEQLESLLFSTTKSELSKMGEIAREWAQELTPENQAQKYLEFVKGKKAS